MSRTIITLIIIGVTLIGGHCQIEVNNPSFEDEPADATTPHGWQPCSDDTTPDILPGFWGVYQKPSHGNTYVGIITRSNGSFEAIGQRLSDTLLKDQCYRFAIDLAHSSNYAGYNGSLKLRVYLGSDRCETQYLIYESPLIEHHRWKTYPIQFTAEKDMNYIILRAYHQEAPVPWEGNILIDNFTSIKICGGV